MLVVVDEMQANGGLGNTSFRPVRGRAGLLQKIVQKMGKTLQRLVGTRGPDPSSVLWGSSLFAVIGRCRFGHLPFKKTFQLVKVQRPRGLRGNGAPSL